MARVKTFANAGTLLPTDLNAIQDDYDAKDAVIVASAEYAFSSYKTILPPMGVAIDDNNDTGPILLSRTPPLSTVGFDPGATAGVIQFAVYLDPADFAAGSRTSKLRLRAQCITNAVAPNKTITAGMYPITAFGGASGAHPYVQTLGTVVTGSTVAFATPALSTRTPSTSGDFTFPSAGWYSFALSTSGAMAVGSRTVIMADLQVRQV